MAVYLIRHGSAGDRKQWRGSDADRPLSTKGRRQADALVELLAGRSVGRIVSSPFLRCVQTVEPLAARLGLLVETDDALAEAATADDVEALVRKLAAENPALCTHGDVIPTLLDALVSHDGLSLPDGHPCAKGSVWVLMQGADDTFSSAQYLPAP